MALLVVGGCQSSDLPSSPATTKALAAEPAPAPAAPRAPAPAEPAAPATPGTDAAGAVPPAIPAPIAPTLKAGPKGEVRAALLVPLSGPSAAIGTMLSSAAQLAVFEVGDEHFDLIPVDTKGTPDGAAAAARQALTQGADIILGPVFSPEVKAAAPVARQQSIPVVAFTTDRSALGNGVYSVGFLPAPQVRRVVAQAMADNRGRFAVLAPDNEYGHAMADALQDAVVQAGAGARVVRSQFYDPAAPDLTAVAKRFTDYDRHRADLDRDREALSGRAGSRQALYAAQAGAIPYPYDAVLLPDDGVRLKSVASLITYYGIDPAQIRLLGTMLWDDPRLADEPALQGGWYPVPPPAAHVAFEARYLKAFGPLPARFGKLASSAYDATALAAVLARRGQGDYSQAALTSADGFAGVDGIFRLLPDGTADRGLEVLEVERGGPPKEVSPAPTAFGGPMP